MNNNDRTITIDCSRPTYFYWFVLIVQKDVSIRRIVQHELETVLRIKLENTTEDIRDSDFFMLSDKTSEFEEHFGGDKIVFPTDKWMETFDKQEEENDTHNEQHRGFKNGYADIGFGREGVSQSAEESQKGNKDIIFATPHLINKNKFDYKLLGNLPDLIQLTADKYIFDGGKELIPRQPDTRDELFAKKLREITGLLYSCFESYTIVRQLLGRKEDVDKVSFIL